MIFIIKNLLSFSFSFESLTLNPVSRFIMKKLLFVAALGVAGVMSAKCNGINSLQKEKLESKDNFAVLLFAYDWVPVHTSCGKTFYLDGNDYTDCYECLQEHARQFTDAQCGAGASFELPY